MLKKNKSRIIISSIIILLPMIFGLIMWDKLPDTMTTHWGADGNADGFSGKVFAVFGLPAITLILHFVCLLFTLFDKKQKEQNPKALGMIFWILLHWIKNKKIKIKKHWEWFFGFFRLYPFSQTE